MATRFRHSHCGRRIRTDVRQARPAAESSDRTIPEEQRYAALVHGYADAVS
jgi:hypothetical protein